MNTSTFSESAKIYQFPVRPRMAVASNSEMADRASCTVVEFMSQRVSDAVLGDCWYHDAEIRQSVGSTKP